jgi:hypothetical protein
MNLWQNLYVAETGVPLANNIFKRRETEPVMQNSGKFIRKVLLPNRDDRAISNKSDKVQ